MPLGVKQSTGKIGIKFVEEQYICKLKWKHFLSLLSPERIENILKYQKLWGQFFSTGEGRQNKVCFPVFIQLLRGPTVKSALPIGESSFIHLNLTSLRHLWVASSVGIVQSTFTHPFPPTSHCLHIQVKHRGASMVSYHSSNMTFLTLLATYPEPESFFICERILGFKM